MNCQSCRVPYGDGQCRTCDAARDFTARPLCPADTNKGRARRAGDERPLPQGITPVTRVSLERQSKPSVTFARWWPYVIPNTNEDTTD